MSQIVAFFVAKIFDWLNYWLSANASAIIIVLLYFQCLLKTIKGEYEEKRDSSEY